MMEESVAVIAGSALVPMHISIFFYLKMEIHAGCETLRTGWNMRCVECPEVRYFGKWKQKGMSSME
jgi:hypothetical protein